MVAELTFEYMGLTFGGSTDYSITHIDGLAPPDAREEEVERPIEHGSYIYSEFIAARRISFEGYIAVDGPVTLEARIASMKAAFRNQLSPQPLTLKLPGQPQKRIYCNPRRRYFPIDNDYALGFGAWAAEFTAGDPRLYADDESSLNASGTAVNAGDFSTYPVVTILGAATNPTIENSSTGESLQIDEAMSPGDTLVIDFLQKTVLLNDNSVYSSLDPAQDSFFTLEPGNNSIVYSGGGTFEMRWRSAWY